MLSARCCPTSKAFLEQKLRAKQFDAEGIASQKIALRLD